MLLKWKDGYWNRQEQLNLIISRFMPLWPVFILFFKRSFELFDKPGGSPILMRPFQLSTRGNLNLGRQFSCNFICRTIEIIRQKVICLMNVISSFDLVTFPVKSKWSNVFNACETWKHHTLDLDKPPGKSVRQIVRKIISAGFESTGL